MIDELDLELLSSNADFILYMGLKDSFSNGLLFLLPLTYATCSIWNAFQPSFDKVVPPSFRELGLAELVSIYNELSELGKAPCIIDAADLQRDPEVFLLIMHDLSLSDFSAIKFEKRLHFAHEFCLFWNSAVLIYYRDCAMVKGMLTVIQLQSCLNKMIRVNFQAFG